jgi:nitrogen fixation NifU-like protein
MSLALASGLIANTALRQAISVNDDRMQRYSEIIIEHSQFPCHHGTLKNPTHEGNGENPFCGDRVKLQFKLNPAGIIEHAAAESVGCAISMASASLLATHLHGLNLQQAGVLFEQVHQVILEGPDDTIDQQLGELAALAFAGRYPSRVKCATLPWHVLKHALADDKTVVSTE